MTGPSQRFSAAMARVDRSLDRFDGVVRFGRVNAVVGPVIRATVPEARIGGMVRVRRTSMPPLDAEVIGFDRQEALLMPLAARRAIAASPIRLVGQDRDETH